MSASSLGGIWTCSSLTFPDHAEFMSIDESRGRIIAFHVISIEPVKRAPIRSWYRPESDTSIAARLGPAQPWRITEFQLDGDRVSWISGSGTSTWQRLLSDEQPDWLDRRLTAENSKMDADEAAREQARRDFAAGKPKIYEAGGDAIYEDIYEPGISDNQRHLVARFPRDGSLTGCANSRVGYARSFATAYNQEIVSLVQDNP